MKTYNFFVTAIVIILSLEFVLTVTAEEKQKVLIAKPIPTNIVQPIKKVTHSHYVEEHFKLKKGDILDIRMHGKYEVVDIHKNKLILHPLPNQKGLLDKDWAVSRGRSHIGNHHHIEVSKLDAEKKTAEISFEYKTRMRWWDINF